MKNQQQQIDELIATGNAMARQVLIYIMNTDPEQGIIDSELGRSYNNWICLQSSIVHGLPNPQKKTRKARKSSKRPLRKKNTQVVEDEELDAFLDPPSSTAS